MGRVEQAIEIMAPVEKVFDVLVDLDGLPQWATIVVRTNDVPETPLRAGDIFRQRIRAAGKELDTNWRVVELDRPRYIVYEATGPAGGRLRMKQTVESAPAGSRVELDIDYRMPGGLFAQIMDRLGVGRRNRREAERSLQNLKRLVERQLA